MLLIFFASSLNGLCSSFKKVRAFRTDGEKALSDAFSHEFSHSQHLTCFINVRHNVTQKLLDCKVFTEMSKAVLHDIFGSHIGDVFEEGQKTGMIFSKI